MTNIAIENGHRNSEFSHSKWWCSIVFFVYLPEGSSMTLPSNESSITTGDLASVCHVWWFWWLEDNHFFRRQLLYIPLSISNYSPSMISHYEPLSAIVIDKPLMTHICWWFQSIFLLTSPTPLGESYLPVKSACCLIATDPMSYMEYDHAYMIWTIYALYIYIYVWIINHLLSGMHIQVSHIICHQATLLLLPCFAVGFLHRLSFFPMSETVHEVAPKR